MSIGDTTQTTRFWHLPVIGRCLALPIFSGAGLPTFVGMVGNNGNSVPIFRGDPPTP